MAKLMDLIPDGMAKKVGTALFTEHKGKLAGVAGAATASASQLKNPDKLKEWFEIKDAGSVGKISVDVPGFKKKIKLTITMIDYNKIGSALDKANVWLEKQLAFDPLPAVNTRKKKVEKGFNAFGISYARVGKEDPVTIKLAEKIIMPISILSGEVNQMRDYYSACKATFPRHSKVYAEYTKTFDDCYNALQDLLCKVPLHPDIQEVLRIHCMACMRLGAACRKGRDLCKKLGKRAQTNFRNLAAYHSFFRNWLNQLGEVLAPVKIKEAEKILNQAVKPALGVLKKMMGG